MFNHKLSSEYLYVFNDKMSVLVTEIFEWETKIGKNIFKDKPDHTSGSIVWKMP